MVDGDGTGGGNAGGAGGSNDGAVPPITTPPITNRTTCINVNTTFVIEGFDRNRIKWTRWVERLEGAFHLFHTATNEKLHMLLHYMGQDTYDMLCDKLAPSKPHEETYENIVKMLGEHFDPKPLEIVENFRFHLRKQQEAESIEEYVVALRKLSINCNFGAYLEMALRNQLVFGVRSPKVQNRLLECKDLTLKKRLKRRFQWRCQKGAELKFTTPGATP